MPRLEEENGEDLNGEVMSCVRIIPFLRSQTPWISHLTVAKIQYIHTCVLTISIKRTVSKAKSL